MNKKLNKYDLVVIGGGPLGTPTALEFAKMNPSKKVLLIDKKGMLGGECLFDGCIPSKILEVSGERLNSFNKLKSFGINLTDTHPKLIWKAIVNKKKSILSNRTKGAQKKIDSIDNVTLKKGSASFNDKNSIKIVIEDKSEEIVYFDKVVIGAGSRTFIPPFNGNGVKKAMTNKEFFYDMVLPKDITIIGDGPIGIELTQILSKLGVKVNLIGNRDNILPMIDKTFSNILLEKLQKDMNVNLILSAEVSEINFKNKFFEVVYNYKNVIKNIKSSQVLIATGRTPNIEELNLENASIKFDKKGIIVNEYLQTSNPNIYAGGDIIFKGPRFAHTASYEAHIISQNLFFNRNKFKTDFDKNSWVLFSDPNIVNAGISENEAKNRGIDVITGIYDYSIDAKSQIDNEDFGLLKFVVEKKSLRIIGINIITVNAHSISGEAALIITNKLKLKDLVNTIHPHPTLSESFTFLAKEMMGKIMLERMKNPLFKVGFLIKKLL